MKRKNIKTYSIKGRFSKVNLNNFARIVKREASFSNFYNSLPDILAAKSLKDIVELTVKSYKHKKQCIFMFGGHVIKCGVGPLLIELMKKKIIKSIAMNGAASIHDFEISFSGNTSENVEKSIKDGSFGMCKETGKFMNEAINEGYKKSIGMGEALGRYISLSKFPFKKFSILYNAYKLKLPLTVHVAIGTDVIHQHKETNGAALGDTSYRDFLIFTEEVSKLSYNGIVFNIGSAVVMPEVFLKALNISRNLGYKTKGFTAVNFDMIQHYRPTLNVLQRPTMGSGKAYSITGHHEIMLPLFFQAVMQKI